MHAAAGQGDLEQVLSLLEQGCDLEARTSGSLGGRTALESASAAGHLAVVTALLSAGSVPSLALHHAATAGHIHLIPLLVAHGGDVDDPARKGVSAAHVAAAHGHAGVISALAREGGGCRAVSRPDQRGMTPLHEAARAGKVEAARALLAAGHPCDVLTADGWSPLHCAAAMGHTEVVLTLLAFHSSERAVPQVDHDANGSAQIEKLQFDQHGRDSAFIRPGHAHTHRKQNSESVTLVPVGRDLLITGSSSSSSSSRITSSSIDTISGCGNVNCGDLDGNGDSHQRRLPISGAKSPKSPGGIPAPSSTLLDSPPPALLLRGRTKLRGCTPLFKACENGHEAVAQLLAHHEGCDFDPSAHVDKEGLTLLHAAALSGRKSCLRLARNLLVATKKSLSSPPVVAVPVTSTVANAKTLSPKSRDVINGGIPTYSHHRLDAHNDDADGNVKVDHHQRDVMNPAANGRAGPPGSLPVSVSVPNLNPVNARDRAGCTPLHLAAMRGHAEASEWLIRHGADVDAVNVAGDSPADVAKDPRLKRRLRGQSFGEAERNATPLSPLRNFFLKSFPK